MPATALRHHDSQPAPSPAMSAIARIAYLTQVQDDDRLSSVAVAVAGALIRFTNSVTGLCCPATGTLARVSRLSEKSIQRGRAELVRAGRLRIHRAPGGVTRYELLLDPSNDNPRPHRPQEGGLWDPTPRTVCPGGVDCESTITGESNQGILTEPDPARPVGDQKADGLVDLDTERLVRLIQQAAGGRGWRMDNARSAVQAAVAAAGAEAVEALYRADLAGAGLAAWEISQRLCQLTAAVSTTRSAPPPPATPAPRLDAVSAIVLRELRMADPTTRMQWARRAIDAGANGGPDPATWVHMIATAYLENHPALAAEVARRQSLTH